MLLSAKPALAGPTRLHGLIAAAWLGFAVLDVFGQPWPVPAVEFACGALSLAAIRAPIRVSEFALGAISLAGLASVAILQAGAATLAVWWLPLVPIAAAMGAPRRMAVDWVLASIVAVSAVHLVHRVAGWPSPHPELLLNQVGMALITGAAVIFTQRAYVGQLLEIESAAGRLAHQAEALRKARDLAEERAEERVQFAATLAHEVRTPLNGMLGTAQLLSDAVEGPREQELAQRMVSSGRNLQRMVDDILEFSRIDSAGTDTHVVIFDPMRLVEESTQLFAVRAWEKRLDLASAWVGSSPPPARVIGDASRLRQALGNLVANALRFTESGSVLVLVEQVSGAAESRLRISVRDTGPGIAEAEQARLFKPFSQANSTIGRRFGGTGLGLSVVKRLVEQLGGTVSVVSAPGRGATFTFDVPAVPAAVEREPVERVLTVLVGEPGTATGRALVGRLSAWGHRVLGGSAHWGADWDVAFVSLGHEGLAPAGRRVVRLSGDPRRIADRPGMPVLMTPFRSDELRKVLAQGEATQIEPVFDPDLARRMPLRILVVDDAETNRRVVGMMLERMGYQPFLAESGEVALSVMEERAYDLVLLDLVMPGLDGLEVVRRVPPSRRPRIVVLTANLQRHQAAELEALGVSETLEKPLLVEHLVAMLKRGVATATPAPVAREAGVNRLHALCNGDAALVAQLARTFRDSMRVEVARCHDGLASGNLDLVKRGAHALAGSAPMFGADAVGETARGLEAAAWAGEPLEARVAALVAAATTADRVLASVELPA